MPFIHRDLFRRHQKNLFDLEQGKSSKAKCEAGKGILRRSSVKLPNSAKEGQKRKLCI
jgi:hypothetical protein